MAWVSMTGAISPSQKSFITMEDCLEYSFMIRSVMDDARRKKKLLYLIWFDLRNTFGYNITNCCDFPR